MHYKCQINARLSRNDIPSIWNDPQRDEKHSKWEVNALDSVHFSPNKDIASRPDNTNEFRSHSETRFWNVTPGYLRSSAFFIRRRSELSFSHFGKNRSLFHTSLAIAEINTGAGKRNINRGWCRSICRNGTGENKTKKRRSGAALEGDTDGQEPLWWRLLLAWCHQPQTPFVCQATKLIEIKAGSRWPGIIKSLTNTNKAEKEGARRGAFTDQLSLRGGTRFWGICPRLDVSECVNNPDFLFCYSLVSKNMGCPVVWHDTPKFKQHFCKLLYMFLWTIWIKKIYGIFLTLYKYLQKM